MDAKYLGPKNDDDDICLIVSATIHTILKHKIGETNINTISGSIKLIEGSKKTIVFLPKGTKLFINNALLSFKSGRNLLNFQNIC